MDLGRFGIWTAGLRKADPHTLPVAARTVESLGFSALWIPSSGDIFERCRTMLEATATLVVATGIASVWQHEPTEMADAWTRLTGAHPGRFLLGLGVSHEVIVNRQEPGLYRRPLAKMTEYLKALDAAAPASRDERVLAALGPRMLQLARDAAAGAHPYLVTPDHTRQARAVLGPGRLLCVEQAVAFNPDPAEARAVARAHLSGYATLPNYTNNWRRLGFTDDDIAGGCSDRLVDALVAMDSDDAIRARIDEHIASGANHVCLQVLHDATEGLPLHGWKRLAGLLGLS